jgi:hypothetical protein
MNTRLKLFLVWISGYAISFGMLLVLFFRDDISLEDLRADATRLTGIFAPYLTSIIAFWFAKGAASDDLEAERRPFQIAVICSAFYNFVMIIVLSSVLFRKGEDLVKNTLTAQADLATILSFLVGPAIGFFFGKSIKVKPRSS